MKKRTLLCTTIAGTMFIAGLAMPSVKAATDNAKMKIKANYPISGGTSALVELMNGNTKLTQTDVKELVKAKYPGIDVEKISIDKVNVDGTVGTGAKVTLPSGTELTLVLYGDTNGNGTVDMFDALKVLKYSHDGTELADYTLEAGDVKNDNQTGSMNDALRILKYSHDGANFTNPEYNDDYAEKFTGIEEDVPVETASITSVEVVYATVDKSTVTVNLSKAVEGATIEINGISYLDTKSSNGNTTYTISNIPDSNLKPGNTYKITVKDSEGNVIGEKEFTCKSLNAPTAISVVAGSNNAENTVNASNVSTATFKVEFDTPNTEAVTLVVEVKDEEKDGKGPSTLTFRKDVAALETSATIEGKDLSSLNDGTLKVNAYVIDAEGNKATIEAEQDVSKAAEMPLVLVETAERTASTTASIKVFPSATAKKVYCLVKGVNEPAPSREDIIAKPVKNLSVSDGIATISLEEEDGLVSSVAYRVYMVASEDTSTTDGVISNEIVSVVIPSKDTAKLPAVDKATITATGEDGVYSWNYDESANEGMTGYRVVLKDSANKVVAIKEVALGAEKKVSFFEELKKQSGACKIEIYAIGDGTTKADSEASAEFTAATVAPVVSDLNVMLDANTRTLLKWTLTSEPINVKDYTLEVYKYNTESKNDSRYDLLTSESGLTEREYDVANIINKEGAGQYAFVVKVNPKDDVLMSTKASEYDIKKTYNGPVYYNITDKITLTSSDITSVGVSLSGKLPGGDFEDGVITYTLEQSKDGSAYSVTSTGKLKTKNFSVPVTGLDEGSVCYFRVKTVVKDADASKQVNIDRTNISNEGYVFSEVLKVNLLQVIKDVTSAKYMPYAKSQSQGEFSSDFKSNTHITYNDGTIYVYAKSNMKSYTLDNIPNADSLVSVLEQLKADDEITIDENNKITKLTLKDENYDLGTNAKDADVTLNASVNSMKVAGTVKSITLDAHKYDLSGLTITDKKLTVSAAGADITLSTSADVTLDCTSATGVTVNGVKFTASDNLGVSTTYKDNKLTTEGKVTKIEGKNDGNMSLVLKAYEDNLEITTDGGINVSLSVEQALAAPITIKVNSNNNTIDLSKVTVSNANKVTLTTDAQTQYNLVLDQKAKETASQKDLTESEVAISESGKQKIKATAGSGSKVKYSTTAESSTVTINTLDGASVDVVADAE